VKRGTSPGRRSRRFDAVEPSWGFYLLGVAGFVLGVGHYVTAGGGLAQSLEVLMLWALSAVTCHTGYDLAGRSLSRRGGFRAVGYTYVLVFSFVLLATAIVLTWRLEHGQVQEGKFVLIFAGVLGAAVGGRSSLFVVELRESFERNQDLTKLLTVNQRVLRHNLGTR
jgi:two-component system sensor histidine kinase RegB